MVVNSSRNGIEVKEEKKKTDFVLCKSRKTVSKCIQKKEDHTASCNAAFCCSMHSVKT